MPRKRRDVPWLEPRSNGVFYAHWYDAPARRTRSVSLGTSDPAEAQTAFAQFLLNGRPIYEKAAEGLTVAVALDQYILEHVRRNCADGGRQEIIAEHLIAFFGGTLLSDIDIPMSRAYAAARRAGEIGGGGRKKTKVGSDSTIRRELTVLVAAANHARRWKRISADKMPSVELPPESTGETPYLTPSELDLVLGAAEGHLYRFIRLAYWTAGRRKSVETLRASQIDWTGRRINLRKPGERVTKKRRAIVPLYDDLVPDVQWLLANGDGDRLFGGRSMYRPYKTLCEDVGLSHKSHPHVLRHSRATHLLQKGVSIYDVAKLLGDTVTTVERTYGHHSSEYLMQTTG